MNNNDILEQQIGNLGDGPQGVTFGGSDPAGAPAIEGTPSLGRAQYFNARREETDKDKDIARVKTGWIELERSEFGERSQFYPQDWKFYIRPATVTDIKNWSSVDEERLDQVNEVFNEIIKSCVKITSQDGNISWGKICSWDRFWLLCKIREYTFVQGEAKIAYDEECINCDKKISFELTSNTLVFEMPDQDIIDRYWNSEKRVWEINPAEYDVTGPVIKFYVPTLEKDAAIFNWGYKEAREKNKKPNTTLLRFLPWMVQRVTRDDNVNEHYINDAKGTYDMWGMDMFNFADEIIRNINVIPNQKLRTICPHCGEEVECPVRFPNGVRGLFNVQGGHKKFGKK